MRRERRPWASLVILFVALNGLFIAGKNWLTKYEVDQDALILINLVLFLATILSFWISYRSLNSASGGAAVRGMYGSFMAKFFICVVAAFIYIMIAKKNLNKPALFIGMGLYIIYTVIEVSALTKILRQKKNV
jgi:FtsH-binding integral membrane protein